MKKSGNRLVRAALCLCLLFCFALALGLPAQTANNNGDTDLFSAIDPHNYVDRTTAVIYDSTNGLPTNGVNDIAQTKEGFLWIGSYCGLIRYDGNYFELLDASSGLSSIESLFVDSKDRLWIGTNDSGLALMDRGEIRFWDEDHGFPSAKVGDVQESEDGTIYVATTEGLVMITPDLVAHTADDPRLADAYVEQLSYGSGDLLYGITNEDDYFTLRSGKLETYIDHTQTRIQGITSILADPNNPGEIYIGTDSGKLYHGDPDGEISAMECTDTAPLTNIYDIQSFGDQIWICASNGIGVVHGDGFHYLDELPMHNAVSGVIADYEGNLWFTSSRQGLMKVVPNRFVNIFPHYDLPECVVNSTYERDGRLYIATDTGLLAVTKDEVITEIPLSAARTASGVDLGETDLIRLVDNMRIRSVLPDSKGNIWLSTWRGCGLVRYDGSAATVFTEADGLPSNQIRAIAETEDGKIVTGLTGGVSVIEGDRVVANYGKDEGLVNLETLTVCVAPNGDILAGSNGGGIYVINDEGVRCLSTQDGLPSKIVMRIRHDPDHHVFWLLTSSSIAYMTEDYEITAVHHFPYPSNYDICKNSKDDLWILSSNGIYVLPAEEMLANGEIKPVFYGLANGLPCLPTSNSFSWLSPEGDLFIAGDKSVARVNVEEPMEEVSDLRQAVAFIDADGKRYYPDESGAFLLPPRVKKITVYPFVFNYALTDPQVSYQLVGFDPEPVTASRSELLPMTYTNLRGGTYHFVMVLKDALGRNGKTLDTPIVKVKAPYEQAWFYGLIGAAGLALLWALVKMQVRRNTRILEQKHREEAERERIQGELQTANRIQTSVLPSDFPPFPERAEFDLWASMKPAREVGGDFYDFYLIDDDHLALTIADVSGKGIPASLFMMTSKAILKSIAMQSKTPSEILQETNDLICSNNRLDMFVTVWLGILELSTGRLFAANAGHEYPALKRADGKFRLIRDKHGLVIGGMENVKYTEYELQLHPGDKLFVYTDGVPEATDTAQQMFGSDRLIEALNAGGETSPEQVLKNVHSAVDAFVRDAEQFDDLTMLCLAYSGNAPEHLES